MISNRLDEGVLPSGSAPVIAPSRSPAARTSPSLFALALAIASGGLVASLVHYDRTSWAGLSREWALLALVVAASLSLLAVVQTVLLRLGTGRPLSSVLRTVTRSFVPLIALWPLFLAVTFSEAVHHVFVFHPGVVLYWGGVAFVFVVVQVALVPVQLDPPVGFLRALAQGLAGLRHASFAGSNPLPLLVAAFFALRIVLIFAFDPAAPDNASPPFEQAYRQATLADQGVYPYLGFWSEYPPAFPWLSTAIYRAVSFFGVTYDRYYLALVLTLLVFATGTLVLTYKTAEAAWGRAAAVQAAWLYTVLMIPTRGMFWFFDDIPTFFIMLATYLFVSQRHHTAALAITIGALVKVAPLAVVPALLKYVDGYSARLRVVSVGAVGAAAVLLPLWWFGRTWFEASVANMLARPPWETVWAALDGYFGTGKVHDYRLNPAFATAYDYVGRLPGAVWVVPPLGLVLFYAFVAVMPNGRRDARSKVALVLLCVVAFQLALKGFSPQFVLWIIPLILVLKPTGSGFALTAGLTTLEQLRGPIHAALGAWWMVFAVGVRTAVLIALAVWAGRIAFPSFQLWRRRESGGNEPDSM